MGVVRSLTVVMFWQSGTVISASTSARQRGVNSNSGRSAPRSASASNVSNLAPSAPATGAPRVNGSVDHVPPRGSRGLPASGSRTPPPTGAGGPRSGSPAAASRDRARLSSVKQSMRFWRNWPPVTFPAIEHRATASEMNVKSYCRTVWAAAWQLQPKVAQIAYVCITTRQPDTKSNPNPNIDPNRTTKEHAIVNIQLEFLIRIIHPPLSDLHLNMPV